MTAKTNATFPTKWAICTCCSGDGHVSHAAFSNGFTSEEWADMCADYDDRDGSSAADRYLRGDYDVICTECKGSGKVRIPDVERMTFAQKRVIAAERREARQDAYWAAQLRAESAAERAMGC